MNVQYTVTIRDWSSDMKGTPFPCLISYVTFGLLCLINSNIDDSCFVKFRVVIGNRDK